MSIGGALAWRSAQLPACDKKGGDKYEQENEQCNNFTFQYAYLIPGEKHKQHTGEDDESDSAENSDKDQIGR